MLQKYQRDLYPNLPVYDDVLAISVGNVLKNLYTRFMESGMSYKELHAKTGIAESSLRSYFSYKTVPSLSSYIQLIDVL